MPQFTPTYISIPLEIKKNPEKFGLQQDYGSSKKPCLWQVEWCNNASLQANMNIILDDEQWKNYTEAVEIIKRFKDEHQKLPA